MHSFCVSNICRKIIPQLSSVLIDFDQKKRLNNFIEFLPYPFIIKDLIFETAISPGQQWMDIAFRLQLIENSFLKNKDIGNEKTIANEILNSRIWKSYFASFTQDHRDEILNDLIQNHWLCFDIGSSLAWFPEPNLYILSGNTTVDFKDCIHKLCGHFQNVKPTQSFGALIQRFTNQCTKKGLKIHHYAFMFPRNMKGIRLHFGRFTNHLEIKEFLNFIGYNYDLTDLLHLLRRMPSCITGFDLLLDLEDAIHPKLGIECKIDKKLSIPDRKIQWDIFFKFLVAENLTTFEKHQAALQWMGGFKELQEEDLFPGCGIFSYHYYVKNISHVKIVYFPGKEFEAKAYLSMRDLTPQS